MKRNPLVAEIMKPLPVLQPGAREAAAVKQLVRSEDEVTAVVDGDGRLCWLIDRTGRHVAIQTSANGRMLELLDVPEITERLAGGAPGVVVVGDGRPVGFLPAGAILEAIADGYTARPTQMGDETLEGETVLPPLVVVCTTCGYRNELTSLDVGRTRCARGHILGVDGYEL